MQSSQGMDMALEVVTLPVSDVDRAKSFYQRLGWQLDIDAARDDLVSRGVDDQDGTSWQLQEITTRLPGREWED